MKLSIIATHPIQYQIPWFRALAARNDHQLRVYFALLPEAGQQGIGFGIPFEWDVPLLDGYSWELLPNRITDSRLEGFFGSSTPGVREKLAEWRPDAVVITGWQQLPMVQALWACRRLDIPTIVRGESNAMRRRSLWKRWVHRPLLAQYDAFLAIGRSNREFYHTNGVSPEAIFDAPYFVDNARFAAQAQLARPRRDELRASWGISAESTCFLFAGKLQPKKRVLDLLRAFQFAISQNSPVHLLIVGSGEQLEEARRFSKEHRLPITFAGFLNQSQIADAYVAADCLVLPSDAGETWGLVVNEAMACGLPAVISDRVGCGPDLVVEGETGFLFPCGDVDALAAALQHAATDPARLKSMGDRARARVQSYCAESAAEGTIAALAYVTS